VPSDVVNSDWGVAQDRQGQSQLSGSCADVDVLGTKARFEESRQKHAGARTFGNGRGQRDRGGRISLALHQGQQWPVFDATGRQRSRLNRGCRRSTSLPGSAESRTLHQCQGKQNQRT